MLNNILTIDIGGTFIKYGIFDDDYKLVVKGKMATPKENIDSFLKGLNNIYQQFTNIEGIAISMPGLVDADKGSASIDGALAFLKHDNIQKLISDYLNAKVHIENDGRCATLAELVLGNLKDVNDGATIILGTGIGGGIVIDRKIIKGANLYAGELSYLSINLNQNMQADNFFDSYCSLKGIASIIEAKIGMKDISGIEAFKMIKEGNLEIEKIMREVCHKIAMVIYQLQFIIDPEKVLIGGGISEEPLFINYIQEAIKEIALDNPKIRIMPKVDKCYFGNDANLLGALLNYKNRELY